MSGWFTTFVNCRLCVDGKLIRDQLVVSDDNGLILPRTGYIGGDAIDLEDAIIAPGFLELQTNGLLGFHFTHFKDSQTYDGEIDKVSRYLLTQGVTGFWATIPTVSSRDFKKYVPRPKPHRMRFGRADTCQILPSLKPREIRDGASLLGAHAEGPYLFPSKKGAHDDSLFTQPSQSPTDVYGPDGSSSETLKLVTIAPELEDAPALVKRLVDQGTRVSLGHSAASFDQGLASIKAGATCLTHTLNAMAPLHHRDPGLAGLVTVPSTDSAPSPHFSMIPDGNHLHPSVVAMLYRANPERAIVITDSIELAGLEDGIHPGHAQIPHQQRKVGSRVTIDGTDTLIGGCASLQECVRNLMAWSGCDVAEAVQTVTKNIADLMGLRDRGRLEAGRRADFVVLNDQGEVLQTWLAGRKVWDRGSPAS